jgi:hypothetical protein
VKTGQIHAGWDVFAFDVRGLSGPVSLAPFLMPAPLLLLLAAALLLLPMLRLRRRRLLWCRLLVLDDRRSLLCLPLTLWLRGRSRLHGLLRWTPAGWALYSWLLTRRLWRLTLGLGLLYSLLTLRLRGRGLLWLLRLFAPPLRLESRVGRRSNRLRRRWAGALAFLWLLLYSRRLLTLPLLSVPWLLRLHCWPLTLSPGWLLALHRLLTTHASRLLTAPLLLLSHYWVFRLILVVLLVDGRLLLHAGISIP